MSNSITLQNVSFRIVGPFMRVNQPYTAVRAPTNIPFSVTLPEITVEQPPTVGALMAALPDLLANYVDPHTGQPTPLTFKCSNLEGAGAPPDTLDSVSFGPPGAEFTLSASVITDAFASAGLPLGPNGEKLGAAWQYYVFNKDPAGRDERVEVSGRSRYTESVMVRDDSRIIWRLICTYLNPTNDDGKTDVKKNGVLMLS